MNRRARRSFKQTRQLPFAEGGPIRRDDPRYSANQVAGQGVVGRAQAGRAAAIDAAEQAALQPTATPEPVVKPAPVAPTPKPRSFLGLRYVDGGRIQSRVITEEEPWKRDALGNLPSEWPRNAAGSIVSDSTDGGLALPPPIEQTPDSVRRRRAGLRQQTYADGDQVWNYKNNSIQPYQGSEPGLPSNITRSGTTATNVVMEDALRASRPQPRGGSFLGLGSTPVQAPPLVGGGRPQMERVGNIADMANKATATPGSSGFVSSKTPNINSLPKAPTAPTAGVAKSTEPVFDRSRLLFDPTQKVMPTVGESLGTGFTGVKINPKTGYSYADGGGVGRGGPETDNYSTARYANKYDGPGGVRDIPRFAKGGLTGTPYRNPWTDPQDAEDQVSRSSAYRRMLAEQKRKEEANPDETDDIDKPQNYADGGLPAMRGHQIKRRGLRGGVDDGLFYGEGGPTEDRIDIKASPGEFIFPADSTQKIGLGKLRDMVDATHKPVHLTRFAKDGTPQYGPGGEIEEPLWKRILRGTRSVGSNLFSRGRDAVTDFGRPGADVPRMNTLAPSDIKQAQAAREAAQEAVRQRVSAGIEPPLPPSEPTLQARSIPPGVEATPRPGAGIGTDFKPPTTGGGFVEGLKGFGRALLSPAAVGTAAALHSTDTGEPTDTTHADLERFWAGKPAGLRFSDNTVDRNPAFRNEIVDAGFKIPVDPTKPVRGIANALDVAAPVGGGTISGGGRSVGYTKDSLPLPMGVTDTSTPEEKAADAARRAVWVQQAKDIDTKNAAAAQFENRSLNDMVQRSQQNVANYDLQQGIRNRDPAAVAAASQVLGQIKDDQGRMLARDLKGQEVAGEMARANVIAAASRYGAELGLKGHELTAQATLMGNIINREASMAQLGHTIGRENAKDFQEELASRAQVFGKDKDGKPFLDVEGTAQNVANLKRFMIDPSAEHIAILQAIKPGAKSLNDIPREKWGTVLDRAKINIGIGAAAGGEGMPSGYDIRERGLGDAFGGRGINSQVPFWSTAGNALNPFAPPERNFTLRTQTPGSLPTDTVLEDIAAGDRGRYETILGQLRRSDDPKQQLIADELMKRRGLR